MEIFNFTTFLFFAPFTFLLIKLCKKLASSEGKNQKKLRPPSPPKLPLIGHLHHLIGAGLPHQALHRLTQKYGPVLHLKLGQVSAVVISSREAAKEVLKNQDPACAGRPESMCSKIMFYDNTNIGFSPYSEYWRQVRKICVLQFLSAKNVRSFGSIRQDEASRLVKSLQSGSGGSVVNLTDKILGFMNSVICRAAVGKVTRGHETLDKLLKKVVPLISGFGLADLFPSSKLLRVLSWNKYKMLSMRRKLDVILDAILEEHRVKRRGEFGGEDIVDVLLRVQRNQDLQFPITNDNIKAIIFLTGLYILDLLIGGNDTSSTAADWAMAELMRNPRAMAKLQAEVRSEAAASLEELQELKYLKCVVKETLRLHPPGTLLPRACRDKCKVDGYSIPLKSQVMVNIWSLGRDPQYWDEPESFRPERFEKNTGGVDFLGNHFEYIPFGTGKRMCPGMNFGLANVELLLAKLLYHFDWEMPKGMTPDDIDMSEAGGIAISRKSPLFLVPIAFAATSSSSSSSAEN